MEQAKANLALKRENVSYDLSNADSPVKHFPTSNFDQTASWDTSPENEQFSQAQKIDSHVQNFHESEDHDEYDPMRYQYDKTVSTKQPASNNVSRAKSTNSKTNEEPQNDNNAVVRNARGRIEHRYPDGRKTLQYDDNSERVVYPDGTKITTFKNGDTLKVKPIPTTILRKLNVDRRFGLITLAYIILFKRKSRELHTLMVQMLLNFHQVR